MAEKVSSKDSVTSNPAVVSEQEVQSTPPKRQDLEKEQDLLNSGVIDPIDGDAETDDEVRYGGVYEENGDDPSDGAKSEGLITQADEDALAGQLSQTPARRRSLEWKKTFIPYYMDFSGVSDRMGSKGNNLVSDDEGEQKEEDQVVSKTMYDLPDNISDVGDNAEDWAAFVLDKDRGTRKSRRNRLRRRKPLEVGHMCQSYAPKRKTPFL